MGHLHLRFRARRSAPSRGHFQRRPRASQRSGECSDLFFAARPPKATEVILDAADGLDWPTLCKCDLSYLVPKAKLYERRGTVSHTRRRAIFNTLLQCFELIDR